MTYIFRMPQNSQKFQIKIRIPNPVNMEQTQPINPRKQRYQSFWQLLGPVLCYNLGSFYFGYSMIYLNVIDFQQIYYPYSIHMEKHLAEGICTGSLSFGAIFGCLLSGRLVQLLSRRHNFFFANTLAFIGGILILLHNMYSLVLGRIIQGMAVGVYTSVITLTVKQFSPLQVSGSLGALKLVIVLTGFVFPTIIAYIFDGSKNLLLILFCFPFLPSLLQQVLLMTAYTFETPKYYLMKGQVEKCRKFIEIFYNPEFHEDVLNQKIDDLQIQINIVEENQEIQEPESNNTAIFLAFYMHLLMQLAGINVFSIYTRQIAVKFYPPLTKQFPIFVQVIRLLASLLTTFILKCFGRKQILLLGLALQLLLSFCLWIYLHFNLQASSSGLVLIILILLLVFNFSITLSPVCWLYIPQIIQPSLVPPTTLTNWLYTCMIVIVLPLVFNGTKDFQKISIVMIFGMLASFFIVRYVGIQTKDKTELQIRQEFNMKKIC